MPSAKLLNIALVGNPNSGKSSLFNHLTGLNQKIGNFPGVTVDKKIGFCRIDKATGVEVIDLPGTYSLYPKSLDEQVVLDFLNNREDPNYPDIIVVVVDASNLKRNLLLFTQIADLGFPVILALNMLDVAVKSGMKINIEELKKELKVPIISINARSGLGVNVLKNALASPLSPQEHSFLKSIELAPNVVKDIRDRMKVGNDYLALLLAHQYRKNIKSLSAEQKQDIEAINVRHGFQSVVLQIKETSRRYEILNRIINNTVSHIGAIARGNISSRIDKVATHAIWGYVVFFLLLFLIFQAIFAWASLPMDLIDQGISSLNAFLKTHLPAGALTGLLTDGLIAGLGGVVMFVPQIAILFTFISILEESGYMSRVMFMMDTLMRKFGMNGRSVVPLISGVACAVPAIMATRSIDNWKDRIITIFVTPLMSCSARIPVFTILIALAVPDVRLFGLLNVQGLALMGLYLLGFLAAIISGYFMHLLLKTKQRSYFIMEFPSYKMPRWKNVGITIVQKVKAFVFEAGKVIIAISIVLWVLASYGPKEKMASVESSVRLEAASTHLGEEAIEQRIAAKKLEYSYAGSFGKLLEPVIKPLGFDWKIGIALITSFAAREVFIGTMSTIYSVGAEDEGTLKKRMKEERDPVTGQPVYTVALAFSLLIFYLFAMQCMSTLAITYRETKGWTWPVLQFVYMTGLAYVSSFVVYQVMK